MLLDLTRGAAECRHLNFCPFPLAPAVASAAPPWHTEASLATAKVPRCRRPPTWRQSLATRKEHSTVQTLVPTSVTPTGSPRLNVSVQGAVPAAQYTTLKHL